MSAEKPLLSLLPKGVATKIDECITQYLAGSSVPGLAIALTNRAEILYSKTYGYKNLAAKTTLSQETLFDIASIGKWFTALATLQQCDAGVLDLHTPIETYLPWLKIQSRFEPITIHHLLSHTAGLASAYMETPGSHYDALTLGYRALSIPPGRYFFYSNTGYKIVGFILEALTGRSRATIIEQDIFTPLGMQHSVASVLQQYRDHMAVGYTATYDDRPSCSGEIPRPATWTEFTTGDGGGLSTAEDLTAYLRMILNRGQGKSGKLVLSPEAFDRMISPVSHDVFGWKGLSYGYGTYIEYRDGRLQLGHGGGSPGYQSLIIADIDAGLGAAVLINHGQGSIHTDVAHESLALLYAAYNKTTLQQAIVGKNRLSRENVQEYAGTYRNSAKKEFSLRLEGTALICIYNEEILTLEFRGNDVFYSNHADFSLFLLRAQRVNGQVVEITHGSDWYINDRYTGPTTFSAPSAWDVYTGHYRSHNPWVSNFRVVLRKDVLFLIYPHGSELTLSPLAEDNGVSTEHLFRIGENPNNPERLQFDTIIEHKALRVLLSEEPYYRSLTP